VAHPLAVRNPALHTCKARPPFVFGPEGLTDYEVVNLQQEGACCTSGTTHTAGLGNCRYRSGQAGCFDGLP